MSNQDTSRPRTTRTIIVDDDPIVREALTTALGSETDIEVVAVVANGAEAVDVVHARTVDVVLMDVQMPVLDGVAATSRILALGGGTRVLLLTTFDDDDLVLAALGAGAHGFLLKDAEPTTLLEAIRVVARGGSWLDPAVTGTVLAHLDAGAEPGSPQPPTSPSEPAGGAVPVVGAPSGPYEPLTVREDAVLALVCQGLSNARIGERLHVAESTVKSHVKTILGKTGCHNRVELVIYALTTGLVQPQ